MPNDLIQYILGFLNPYLIHDINYIKEKIISLGIYFLKQINHSLNTIIELYNKIEKKYVLCIIQYIRLLNNLLTGLAQYNTLKC